MCITARNARLTNTILYAGEAMRNGTLVHVLGYQNKAENLSGRPNAMILPLPAKGVLGPENMIDTRAASSILTDLVAAVEADESSRSLSKGIRTRSVQVFDRGSYTVVLAENASDIPNALRDVVAERRPDISTDLLQSFGRLYPTWPIAVCCFDGRIKPEPLLWWFEPRDADYLWAPALDSHDGSVPRVGNPVNVDHTVVFGSTVRAFDGSLVHYRDKASEVEPLRSLLPTRVTGEHFRQKAMRNGDFRLAIRDIEAPWKTERVAPPGWTP